MEVLIIMGRKPLFLRLIMLLELKTLLDKHLDKDLWEVELYTDYNCENRLRVITPKGKVGLYPKISPAVIVRSLGSKVGILPSNNSTRKYSRTKAVKHALMRVQSLCAEALEAEESYNKRLAEDENKRLLLEEQVSELNQKYSASFYSTGSMIMLEMGGGSFRISKDLENVLLTPYYGGQVEVPIDSFMQLVREQMTNDLLS